MIVKFLKSQVYPFGLIGTMNQQPEWMTDLMNEYVRFIEMEANHENGGDILNYLIEGITKKHVIIHNKHLLAVKKQKQRGSKLTAKLRKFHKDLLFESICEMDHKTAKLRHSQLLLLS